MNRPVLQRGWSVRSICQQVLGYSKEGRVRAASVRDAAGKKDFNLLQVLAFRYTFITSVQLLNSFTVPCVFVM